MAKVLLGCLKHEISGSAREGSGSMTRGAVKGLRFRGLGFRGLGVVVQRSRSHSLVGF